MSVISLTDYQPSPRFDEKAWIGARIEGTSDLIVWHEVETFTFDDPDVDPTEPVVRNFTTELVDPTYTYVRVVFIDDDGDQDATDPVALVDTPVLATVRDIRESLGSPFSDRQETQAEILIRLATINLYVAVDKGPDYVPTGMARQFLSGLCISVVMRAMSNPQALGQLSETIGSYSYTQTFAREVPGAGLMLMPAEELAARRLVWGSNTGSSRPRNPTVWRWWLLEDFEKEEMEWIA